jgi:hypothetical protein
VTIEEYHLRHSVLQLHSLKPPPQPDYVTGMGHAVPRSGLSCLYRDEPGLHQSREYPLGRDKSGDCRYVAVCVTDLPGS